MVTKRLPMELYPRAVKVITCMGIPVPQPDQSRDSLDEDGIIWRAND